MEYLTHICTSPIASSTELLIKLQGIKDWYVAIDTIILLIKLQGNTDGITSLKSETCIGVCAQKNECTATFLI